MLIISPRKKLLPRYMVAKENYLWLKEFLSL